jgi:hypothetical protein
MFNITKFWPNLKTEGDTQNEVNQISLIADILKLTFQWIFHNFGFLLMLRFSPSIKRMF